MAARAVEISPETGQKVVAETGQQGLPHMPRNRVGGTILQSQNRYWTPNSRMDTEVHPSETAKSSRKRNSGKKRVSKVKKKMRVNEEPKPKVRDNRKMQKLFKKRVKEYDSDDDEPAFEAGDMNDTDPDYQDASASEDEGLNALDIEENGLSEDEGDEVHDGTKFMEGSRAFRMAFRKIMKNKVSNDPLGPVLSGQKKLVAEKLAEEEAERKVKGEAKKEKHMVREKGHVKPANVLDAKEKFLISVATKGVVKLFNAVSKAQNSQRGLNPSKSKDAKGKRRKQTFLSELRKPLIQGTDNNSSVNFSKGTNSARRDDKGEPGWAPLRDTYMLTDSKLKNWDKIPDPSATVVSDEMPLGSSDDE